MQNLKPGTVEYFEEIARHFPTESCCFMEALTEILRNLKSIERNVRKL